MEKKAANIVSGIYFLLLVCVFPLLEHDQYNDILTVKSKFFNITTLIMFAALALIGILAAVHYKKTLKFRPGIDRTDGLLLLFLAALTLAFLLAPDRTSAFWGTDGRKTGYLVLLLCCGIFWVGRYLWNRKWYLIVPAASAAVFINVIAVCNHLGGNPFSLCGTAGDKASQFISTLGNRNCLAAYIALLLAVTVPFFCKTDSKKMRLVSGGFLAVLFLGMFASMSDSVCLAFAAIMLVTLWFVMPNPAELKRWGVAGIIWAACMYLFLFLRVLCRENCWNMYGIWKLVLSGKPTLALTAAVAAVFFFLCFYAGKQGTGENFLSPDHVRRVKKVRLVLFLCILALIAGAVFVIVWSTLTKTPEEAKELFGVLTPYLYFGEKWGSNRGIIWRSAASTFAGMPAIHKIFGYGPACFKAAYELYDSSGGYMKLNGVLVDAHNEALQYLVTTGIFGVISYFGFFVSAIAAFIKKRRENCMGAVMGIAFVSAFLVQGFVNNTHLYIEPPAFFITGILLAAVNVPPACTFCFSGKTEFGFGKLIRSVYPRG
ncbi:MAG: O-antigen ligase family protein [Eubacterium sp.]|nr:O-antigen ligase family protein [Eubacterium sp.]